MLLYFGTTKNALLLFCLVDPCRLLFAVLTLLFLYVFMVNRMVTGRRWHIIWVQWFFGQLLQNTSINT